MAFIYKFLSIVSILLSFQLHAQELAWPDTVTEKGSISIPENYRETFVFLGTWFLDIENSQSQLMQHVYTNLEAVRMFKQYRQWPDGSVLVKEQLMAETTVVEFGKESWGSTISGIFVMVKDSEQRFPDNPLWGDGWGWSFFPADNLDRTISTDYKKDCLGCHEPARETDMIFIKGYPQLH